MHLRCRFVALSLSVASWLNAASLRVAEGRRAHGFSCGSCDFAVPVRDGLWRRCSAVAHKQNASIIARDRAFIAHLPERTMSQSELPGEVYRCPHEKSSLEGFPS